MINVKKIELTKAVLATLVFASSSVMAGSDYPAADFQPKVVFSDESASQSSAASAPAVAAEVEFDENFPAANYQPKVVYNDADYKHSAAAPGVPGASKSTAVSSSAADSAESVVSEQVQGDKASSDFTLIGLIALAAAGFFVLNKGGKGGSAAASEDYSAAGGSTGVEKYLEKMGANKTGVAKYLEKQTANPSTGVAKYMAKQIIKDREAAAAKATGVEKYLRDNG